jgi:hypothetical protein
MSPDRRANDHAAFRLLAAAAVDGRIDPYDAADLDAHLATCPACRADQQAMLADHTWLASPARALGPDPRIREAVLEAARSSRVPRSVGSNRPWSALVATTLVVAAIGGGLILAGQAAPFDSSPSPSTSVPSTSRLSIAPTSTGNPNPAPTDGIPFVEFTGRAVGRAETTGDLELVVSIQGLGVNATGTVQISRNAEEPWSGTITRATYWHGAYGTEPHWVALLEGCVAGVDPCQQYVVQLFDGGASTVHLDDIRFWLPVPGATEPPDDTRVYQVVSGDVIIGGSMPGG